MIYFNRPPYIETADSYMKEAILSRKISGDGVFTKKCNDWITKATNSRQTLLTTSGTHALEMAALLCEIERGDEVIMPSYTFTSTANAFMLRGAKIIFIDIRPDTMNMDEKLIESAITSRTKAIVPVHYAGVPCEMDVIMKIAREHNLYVIEDAAQALMSSYKGIAAGSLGDYGCFSFHETKNYSMGEGGAIVFQDSEKGLRAEIIREKGTNRSQFFRGQIDKYTWVDVGSSYLPSELNAAYLWAQLEKGSEIKENRLKSWNRYYSELWDLHEKEYIELPSIPNGCEHNGHIFYLKTRDIDERTKFINYMSENEIMTTFHYVPLHASKAGKVYGEFHGDDIYTTTESERLVRLPIYYELNEKDVSKVITCIHDFYQKERG